LEIDVMTPTVDQRVICWSTGPSGTPAHYALGKVVKLNPKTFRVATTVRWDEPLFPLTPDSEGKFSRRGGGSHPATRHCVPVVSALGSVIRGRMLDQIAEQRAIRAMRVVIGDPRDVVAIDAAVQALGELRDRRTAYHRSEMED
jgi:hypothetical protein